MNYIGLDIHSRTFTMQHLSHHGKLRKRFESPTSAQQLIEAVKQIPAPKILVVEECHLAQWVKHTLEPYVDQLVICDPKRNKWISHEDHADDRSSARKLAELLRGGFIKPIAHPDDAGAQLRSLYLHYYDLMRQTSRTKLKLKAVFRQVAIVPAKEDPAIYNCDHRHHWLDRLKDFEVLQWRATSFYDQLQVMLEIEARTYQRLRGVAKSHPMDRALQTLPGVGPVIASGYLALIESPHRFSRRNKLWSYAGLATKCHESDGQTYESRSSNSGCRALKWNVFQQFNAAVNRSKKDNRFKRKYESLLTRGVHKRSARREVCRAMLSTVRRMWITGGVYEDAHVSRPDPAG